MGKDRCSIVNKVKSALDRLRGECWTPQNEELKQQYSLIKSAIWLSQNKLKSILADCIGILADFPITDKRPLERIIAHVTPYMSSRRIDFYDRINDKQEQDIRHIHDVLDILGHSTPGYADDSREFGLIARHILEKWDELSKYSEIYKALSMFVKLEDITYPIDKYEAIVIIKWIDDAIQESSLEAISAPYPVNISPYRRYIRKRLEIIRYYTDICYVQATGDVEFDRVMVNGYRVYTEKIFELSARYPDSPHPWDDITEDDIQKWIDLEKEGKALFQTLRKNKCRK